MNYGAGFFGVKTPEFGLSEWVSDLVGGSRNAQGGSNLFGASQPAPQQQQQTPPPQSNGQVQGATTTAPTGGAKPAAKPTGGQPSGGQPSGGQPTRDTSVEDAARAQQEAAARAAEARRQEAARKYGAQVQIAQGAKNTAGEQYNWLIDTIGSNKQDLLSQVALNEKQGLDTYSMQEDKTRVGYDKARQEILTTYRDLQTNQEKIMRGSGMGQSSRSQEAQLRLNNLLGKDLTTVSTNEADSLALIGNAVTSLKEKTVLANTSIEREATSKLDKAAIDYKAQLQAIDNNLTLSANEREDAYSAAESQLATDTANIQTWAAGLKLQQQQAAAKMQELLDGYIVDMTDANGLLSADLGTKEQATNKLLAEAGFTPIDTIQGAENVTSGVYQAARKTYGSKDELDQALASGAITPVEYNQQLQALQSAGQGSGVALAQAPQGLSGIAPRVGGNSTTTGQQSALLARDPLLAAMFA